VCTCSPESQTYPGPHQKKRGQQVKGGDSAALLRSGETHLQYCVLGLFSLEKRRRRGHLIVAFQYSKGAYRKDGDKLCSKACCDRTRSNGVKLREGRFRLDIRKKFFTMSVVKHWHRLPREVVDAPSLETSMARLDGALSNLIWLKMSLLTAGGLG